MTSWSWVRRNHNTFAVVFSPPSVLLSGNIWDSSSSRASVYSQNSSHVKYLCVFQKNNTALKLLNTIDKVLGLIFKSFISTQLLFSTLLLYYTALEHLLSPLFWFLMPSSYTPDGTFFDTVIFWKLFCLRNSFSFPTFPFRVQLWWTASLPLANKLCLGSSKQVPCCKYLLQYLCRTVGKQTSSGLRLSTVAWDEPIYAAWRKTIIINFQTLKNNILLLRRTWIYPAVSSCPKHTGR